MVGENYRVIDLSSRDTFVRNIKRRSTEEALPIINFDWYEFELDRTWEVWEDEATLYYQASVDELATYEGEGYVRFKVIGKPIKQP